MVSWRDGWVGQSPLVVQPATTEELAQVVRICAATRTPIVPQGGNTGLTVQASRIRILGNRHIDLAAKPNSEIDIENDTMTVEAGCVLANIQQAAKEAGRMFPL